jgi:hypothetical protein
MADLDALIDKVANPALRQALREQVDSLIEERSVGLVYQRHEPETVELPHFKVRRGSKVRIKSGTTGQLHLVESVSLETAHIISLDETGSAYHRTISGRAGSPRVRRSDLPWLGIYGAM